MNSMPFGKFRGVPLAQLDGGYFDWLADKLDTLGDPLRSAVAAEAARRKQGAPATEIPIPPATTRRARAVSAAAPPATTGPITADAIITAGAVALTLQFADDRATVAHVTTLAGRLRGLAGAAGLMPSEAVPF